MARHLTLVDDVLSTYQEAVNAKADAEALARALAREAAIAVERAILLTGQLDAMGALLKPGVREEARQIAAWLPHRLVYLRQQLGDA